VKRAEKALAVLAMVTLAIAYAVPMFMAEEPDYLPQLHQAVPEADRFEKCRAEPPVYRALAERDGQEVVVAYEGPVVTAVVCDPQGTITGVTVIEHTEWLTWYNRVLRAGFVDDFVGRSVADPLALGEDIDAVSSATFTSRGIADGVQEAAHAIARSEIGLQVAATGRELELTTEAVLTAAIWVAVIVGFLLKRNKLRWLTLVASLAALGFWLAAPLSLATLSGLLLGRIPPLDTAHLVWYLMVTGLLGTIAPRCAATCALCARSWYGAPWSSPS